MAPWCLVSGCIVPEENITASKVTVNLVPGRAGVCVSGAAARWLAGDSLIILMIKILFGSGPFLFIYFFASVSIFNFW